MSSRDDGEVSTVYEEPDTASVVTSLLISANNDSEPAFTPSLPWCRLSVFLPLLCLTIIGAFWGLYPSSYFALWSLWSHATHADEAPPVMVSQLSVGYCPRSHLYSLADNSFGLGVGLVLLLQTAQVCNVHLQNKTLFIRDIDWNYHSWSSLFLPPSAMAPLLGGWDNDTARGVSNNLTEASWDQLSWPPALSTLPLSFIQPKDTTAMNDYFRHGANGGEYPSSMLAPTPRTAPSFAMPYSQSTECLLPHGGSSIAATADWTLNSLASHTRGVQQFAEISAGIISKTLNPFTVPPYHLQYLFLSSPHLWGNERSRSRFSMDSWLTNTTLLETEFLHSSRLSSLPDARFLMMQRIWHQSVVPTPYLRHEAQTILRSNNLRTRSVRVSALRRQLRRLGLMRSDPYPTSSASLFPESPTGHGYIALHVRRQDKQTEWSPTPAFRYLEEVELILAEDKELVSSFPTVPFSSLSSACLHHVKSSNESMMGNSSTGSEMLYSQPQIVFVTDDPHCHSEFMALRPCWNFLIDPAKSFAASIERKGDVTWQSLSPEDRRVQAQKLVIEMTLVAEADYAIVTFSSNLGKCLWFDRGWSDIAWEHRLRSVDQGWISM